MSNTMIKYDPSTPGGLMLKSAVYEMFSALDTLSRCAALLAEIDSATTPANVEGGPTFGVAVGQGAAFTNAVVSLSSTLNNANKKQLASLYSG